MSTRAGSPPTYAQRVLAALVPGLRDLRPPLTAGALVLVAGYLGLWDGAGGVAKQWHRSEKVQNLDDLLGSTGWLAVLAVVAYLIGAMFIAARSSIERQSAARLAGTVTSPTSLSQPQSRFMSVFAPFSRPSLRRLGMMAGDTFDQQIAHELCIDIIFGGGKRLLVASPALYDEYERLESEAAFRDAAAIPGLAMLVTLVVELHLSFWSAMIVLALGLALSSMLFVNARQLSREARSMYAHAVCDGSVSTSTLDHGPHRSGRRRWKLQQADLEESGE